MLEKLIEYKYPIAIFIIWLFHINGIFGILYWNTKWFLGNTPINLGISFLLLLWVNPVRSTNFWISISVGFLVGMIAEIIGVNTGIIFGNYWYGENLGYKVWGVPLFIGINWAVLTIIFGSISRKITQNKWLAIPLGALLMVSLDFLIEPSVEKFDFWYWENHTIPTSNYIDWFLIALIPQTVFQLLDFEKETKYAIQLSIVQIIFFGTFFFVYG